MAGRTGSKETSGIGDRFTEPWAEPGVTSGVLYGEGGVEQGERGVYLIYETESSDFVGLVVEGNLGADIIV